MIADNNTPVAACPHGAFHTKLPSAELAYIDRFRTEAKDLSHDQRAVGKLFQSDIEWSSHLHRQKGLAAGQILRRTTMHACQSSFQDGLRASISFRILTRRGCLPWDDFRYHSVSWLELDWEDWDGTESVARHRSRRARYELQSANSSHGALISDMGTVRT